MRIECCVVETLSFGVSFDGSFAGSFGASFFSCANALTADNTSTAAMNRLNKISSSDEKLPRGDSRAGVAGGAGDVVDDADGNVMLARCDQHVRGERDRLAAQRRLRAPRQLHRLAAL